MAESTTRRRWCRGGGEVEQGGGGLLFLKCSLWPYGKLGFGFLQL